ncbi:MAG: helix-turn-helix domain-containing protein [Lachnospiraceae bacterium]
MSEQLFENVEHLKNLPIQAFCVSIGHSSFHWHYEVEVLLVVSGEIIVITKNGIKNLKKGDVLLFNSGEFHEIIRKTENVCLFVQFDKPLFEDYFDKARNYYFHLDSSNEKITLRKNYEYKSFSRILAYIFTLQKEKNSYAINKTFAFVYEFIANLYEFTNYEIIQLSSSITLKKNKNEVNEILAYLEEHYKEEYVIEEICEKFAISNKTLYRHIKNNLGVTITDLIAIRKIVEAKKLLKNTELTILAIVDICGFHSEITFYRNFKKITGVTPHDFRTTGGKEKSNIEIKGYVSYDQDKISALIKEFM